MALGMSRATWYRRGKPGRETEMGSIHGPETGSGRPGRKKDNGMPHPVSPISKAGGSEALAKPFQGENQTKGTPSAHHPAARERSQPKATDPKTKEKRYQAVSTAPSWPSVPIVPRAFDPAAPPDWVLRLRDFAADGGRLVRRPVVAALAIVEARNVYAKSACQCVSHAGNQV